jgi:glycosyltransferase involved in cell wall biosynthesis
MAQKLAAQGVQVHVFCVNTDPAAKPFETSGWSDGEIQVQAMNYAYHDLRTFYDFQHVPHASVVLSEWAERLQLQLVDIHHNLFIGMGVIPTLAASVPTVVTLHDYWPLDPRGQLFPPNGEPQERLTREQWELGAQLTWPTVFERTQASAHYLSNNSADLQQAWVNYSQRTLAASQLLITPSQASANIFHGNGITGPIRVIENGINTDGLHNAIRNEWLPSPPADSKIRLALLGNIAPSKGQLAFCKACMDPELADRVEVHLYGSFPSTYHGDPTPQDELRSLCANNPKTLKLHGAYQREDLPTIFERCDLVVMTSLWKEVYGLIAREALCYGLPLIVSDAGCLRELSTRSRVLTLDHQYPESWAKSIKLWIDQGPLLKWVYWRRLRLPPSDNAVRSSDECATELLSTYEQVLNRLTY